MFQKIAKHRANDASNDVHRPPLVGAAGVDSQMKYGGTSLTSCNSALHKVQSIKNWGIFVEKKLNIVITISKMIIVVIIVMAS